MASYKCRIAGSDGQIKNRIMQAGSIPELKQKVESDGLMLISYRKKIEFRRSSKNKSLYIFTNQLQILVKSGAIMDDALEVIQQSTDFDPKFSSVLNDIRKQIVSGVSLSDALAVHGDYFDPIYCNLIKVGEKSGNLSEVLDGLLEFQKKKVMLFNKATAVAAYPTIVIFMVIVMMTFISMYIIPRFRLVFTELNADVPPLTKFIFSLSSFISANGIIIFPAIIIIILFFITFARKNKSSFINICLYIPFISNFVRNYYLLVFSLAVKILLKGGVQLVDAIDHIASGFPEMLKKKLITIHRGITAGNSFTALLAAESIFPDIFVGLLRVGEKTGRLTEIFENAYEYYYDEFENNIALLTGLIEPVIIIFLGVTIGTIVVSLFLPLVSFMSQMK